MQAVILAAGKSSRLYPIAQSANKPMLELLGKPILEHTLEALKKSGITNILLVVDESDYIKSYFGDGSKLGMSITYVVQKEAKGMGNALLAAKKQIKDDFLLLHGHHVDASDYASDLFRKKKSADGVLLVEKRENTNEYGVIEFSKDKVVHIIEKPEKGKEPSNLCSIGMYVLSKSFLEELSATPDAHYQFEDALDSYASKKSVKFIEATEKTVTLKYPWNLFSVRDYLLSKKGKFVHIGAKIAKSAEIIGEVIIEDGAQIMEGARIKGPVYIGKNVIIGNHTLIRDNTDIEQGCTIGAYMELKNSIIFKNTKTHSGFIGDSIIGENSRVAAQFTSANVRLDRKTVKVYIREKAVDSGLKSLGVIVGSNVKIGIKSSTMPGVVIGSNATIGPSTVVKKNIAENTRYYTKFQEIVEEK